MVWLYLRVPRAGAEEKFTAIVAEHRLLVAGGQGAGAHSHPDP